MNTSTFQVIQNLLNNRSDAWPRIIAEYDFSDAEYTELQATITRLLMLEDCCHLPKRRCVKEHVRLKELAKAFHMVVY